MGHERNYFSKTLTQIAGFEKYAEDHPSIFRAERSRGSSFGDTNSDTTPVLPTQLLQTFHRSRCLPYFFKLPLIAILLRSIVDRALYRVQDLYRKTPSARQRRR